MQNLKNLNYNVNYNINYEFKILNIKNNSIFYEVKIHNNSILCIIEIPIKVNDIQVNDIIIYNNNKQRINLEDLENILGELLYDLLYLLIDEYLQTDILYTDKNEQNYNNINFYIPNDVFVF